MKPDFYLKRIPEAGDNEPGIFPVIAPPWDFSISRRHFLGVCIGAAAGIIGDKLSIFPNQAVAQELPDTTFSFGRAGTWVDPRLLSMVGIAADSGASIEQGYHLRWFADMRFPEDAFPSQDAINNFLKADELTRLVFPENSDSSGSKNTSEKSKDINEGVPSAFFIYRRPHYEHYDYAVNITKSTLRRLRRGQQNEPAQGVQLSLSYISLQEFYKNIPEDVLNRSGYSRNSYNQVEGEALTITFLHGSVDTGWLGPIFTTQPENPITPIDSHTSERDLLIWPWRSLQFDKRKMDRESRVIHFMRLKLITNSISHPRPTAVLGYGENLVEPVREEWLRWKRISDGRWEANINFAQGHYQWIKIVGDNIKPFNLEYSFMDEDTLLAPDQDNPQEGQWVLVESIPFITSFQTWAAAKSSFFRHEFKNRYIDFSGTGVPTDWEGKLDYKYEPLFTKLLQNFLRLRLAFQQRYLNEVGGSSLLGADFEPQLFYQMWSMDPIIASLYSQRYADVTGNHNPKPPTYGKVYDYMITTAWQKPAQRLCYITQKVSTTTTPPLSAPNPISGEQVQGMYFDEDIRHYRTMVSWNAPQAANNANYGYFEPAAYDVMGGETMAGLKLLTHYVDTTAPRGEKVADNPVRQAESPPTDTEGEDTSNSTLMKGKQEYVIDLHKTLQNQDPTVAITATQLAAIRNMQSLPLTDFFNQPDPPIEYTDWIALKEDQKEKDIWYDVRSIDLFGRTSDWHGPLSVKVKHNADPAAPSNVVASMVQDEQGNDQFAVSWSFGPKQVQSGGPVNHFNVLWKDYSPELGRDNELRKFKNWQDNIIQQDDDLPASFKPPVCLSVTSSIDLQGQTISGNITKASISEIPDTVKAEQKLINEDYPVCNDTHPTETTRRIVTLHTNQCFHGISPFVDLATRYQGINNLFDSLKLEIEGKSYDVVSFKSGLNITIGIVTQVNTCNPNLKSRFHNKEFLLKFESLKTKMQWIQKADATHIKEVNEAVSVSANINATTEQQLLSRRNLTIQISDPLSVEFTGRKDWLTNGAWVQYKDLDDVNHSVPIRDSGMIILSADAIWFGDVKTGEKDTKVISITNGSNVPLKIESITNTGEAFAIESFQSAVQVESMSKLDIRVTFAPTALNETNGSIKLKIAGKQFVVQLYGNGIAQNDIPKLENRVGVERQFLNELLLENIVLDLPLGSEQENPAPIFQEELLTNIINNGVPLSFAIHIPPQKILSVKSNGTFTDRDRKSLTKSCTGEIILQNIDGTNHVSCKVLSRPQITSSQNAKLIIRLDPRLPEEPITLTADYNGKFYPDYRIVIPVDNILSDADREKMKKISIALSAHKNPVADGYGTDQNIFVTSPVPVSVIPFAPESPEIPQPSCGEPWVDPFNVKYATLPKILDNKKVVQFKLRLDDPEITGGANISIPSGGAIEIFRAPQDAIRMLMVEQKKPVLGEISPGCPDEVDPTMDEFNELSPEDEYKKIASRLLNTWDNTIYSPKSAFSAIGKIVDPEKTFLIDELEGIATGNIFYASRAIRSGTDDSDLCLFPIRVIIPNIFRPPPPMGAVRSESKDAQILLWRVDESRERDGYEVYRVPTSFGALEIGGMELIAEIPVTETPLKFFAPLRTKIIYKDLQSIYGTIWPWFSDCPMVNVKGIYLKSIFDPEKLPLTEQTGTNYFQPNVGSIYDPITAEIRNVPIPTDMEGKPASVSIVYTIQRQVEVILGQAVNAGELLLPRIQSILGVFLSDDFDPLQIPLQNQNAQDFFTTNTIFTEHYLGNLDITDQAKVTVLFQDQRLGISYLDDLKVLDGRVFLPFGQSLKNIIAVYDLNDTNNQTNLLENSGQFDLGNDKLTNLPVIDGTRVRVFAIAEDLVWQTQTRYCNIFIPALVDDRKIIAALLDPEDNIDLTDSSLITEKNILPTTPVIVGSDLLFWSDVPTDNPVGLVVEDNSGQRSLVRIDDRTYQYTDDIIDSQAYLYRIVSTRSESIDDLNTIIVRSVPTKTL